MAAVLQASKACAAAVFGAKPTILKIEEVPEHEHFLAWLFQRHRLEHLNKVLVGRYADVTSSAVFTRVIKLLEGAPALTCLECMGSQVAQLNLSNFGGAADLLWTGCGNQRAASQQTARAGGMQFAS
jgi:hypothetical protein